MIGVLSVAAVGCLGFFCGCDDGGGSPAASPSLVGTNNQAAAWALDVTTDDGTIALHGTALTISVSPQGGYNVAWVGTTVNGTATLDAGTLVVTIQVTNGVDRLNLFGSLSDNDYMSGSGTISGFNGTRQVHWNATRL